MGIVSTKLRNSARGQDCRFRIPGVCNGNPETVVLCHAPSEFKGMGQKGHDYHASFGCCDCHEALDNHRLHRVDEAEAWLRGMMRTQSWWVANGFIVVPEDVSRAKHSSKILPRKALGTGAVSRNPTSKEDAHDTSD